MAMFQGMKQEMDKMKEGMHDTCQDDEKDKTKSEKFERRIKEVDVSDHVDALMNGEGDLSEEFKERCNSI